jgi:hypothetical protein
MKENLLILILAATMLQGSTCRDSDFIFPGNIDSVSDAALIDCDAYLDEKSQGHTCLLLTNPFKKSLRVFDITDNQFILAPIGYFPLAISVGQIPMRIATLPQLNLGKAFVLDTELGQIFPVFTRNKEKTPSFTSPQLAEGITVPAGSQHIALAKSEDTLWAFVASSGSNQVEKLSLDSTKTRTQISVTSTVNVLLIDTDSNLWIATDKEISVFSPQSMYSNSIASIQTGAAVSKIVTGKITTNEKKEIIVALALLKNEKKVLLLKFEGGSLLPLGEATLVGTPLVGYIPEGTRENCCNNSMEPWAAVLTDSGHMQYLNLQAIIDKRIERDKIGATILVSEKANVSSSKTANPIAIIGATQKEANNANQRKMFLIYSNLILSINEGNEIPLRRIDGN